VTPGRFSTFALFCPAIRFMKEDLRDRFPADFIKEGELLWKAEEFETDKAFMDNFCTLMTVGEGGLLKTLFELAKDGLRGFEIDYENIPINQITVEFCECYDLNPLELLSGDCYLGICPHGGRVCDMINRLMPDSDMGKNARVIGRTLESKEKIMNYSQTKSKMMGPTGEALLKISDGI